LNNLNNIKAAFAVIQRKDLLGQRQQHIRHTCLHFFLNNLQQQHTMRTHTHRHARGHTHARTDSFEQQQQLASTGQPTCCHL